MCFWMYIFKSYEKEELEGGGCSKYTGGRRDSEKLNLLRCRSVGRSTSRETGVHSVVLCVVQGKSKAKSRLCWSPHHCKRGVPLPPIDTRTDAQTVEGKKETLDLFTGPYMGRSSAKGRKENARATSIGPLLLLLLLLLLLRQRKLQGTRWLSFFLSFFLSFSTLSPNTKCLG